ncbi:MAG: hypothetical protein HQL38_05765 [Alphaproteobacteria bacterium]|nr:hypothetical protein [Alphaproteobacteria bacterium]
MAARPASAEVGAAPMTVEERQSAACLAVGGSGTLASLYFGNVEIVNLIAGGSLIPASTGVIAVTLVGVVFLSYCEIGMALNPLMERWSDDVKVAWDKSGAGALLAAQLAPKPSGEVRFPWERRHVHPAYTPASLGLRGEGANGR